ncbi:ParB N-terminal domain-containing protein [Pseudomonas sp. P66]|uniref:ParB N-terminal domain-containing protein n=1 Tax=Pseudomonas arcuscaelestis TaxID=2710591 RepID=A0ABS2BZ34_9PSED|nr:ParB/RepB/Spo0J family partition protein [Pseudomonas arcuscaelestis]MBM5458705.1 ParB N-terminal domain-containing protein [Pseudomonas arcuscaelestis]
MSTPTATQTNKLVQSGSRPTAPSQAQVDAMAESIRSLGILEPLLVNRVGDRYQIIEGGGEVRWLAAQKLGMDIVPIRVVEFDDHTEATVSLMLNMTRESIAPEEAFSGLESLVAEFGEVAEETVIERLPELRGLVAANPEFQSRLDALLSSCSINSREEP